MSGSPEVMDVRTVTCVAWEASGRTIGLGTPDGFLVYSTERLLQQNAARQAAAPHVARHRTGSNSSSTNGSDSRPVTRRAHQENEAVPSPQLLEVCRRAVAGGVGALSLCGQSSVVALAGVRDAQSAATVRLVDASRPLVPALPAASPRAAHDSHDSYDGYDDDPITAVSSDGARSASPSSSTSAAEEDGSGSGTGGDFSMTAAMRRSGSRAAWRLPLHPTDLRPLVLAEATFAATVAAVRLAPCFVLVALTGDPKLVGSHHLFVFDRHLQQKMVFSPFPPTSNRFLLDCIAVASAWAPAVGAGVSTLRFRAMLPGTQKGQLRLLTVKRVSLTGTSTSARASPLPSSDTHSPSRPAAADESVHADAGTHFSAERTLHKSALRAVAITADGRYGVTIGESGTKLRLVEFIDDCRIAERMTLERGKTFAVVDSVSLHIAVVPQTATTTAAAAAAATTDARADGGSGQRLLIACVTSAGTLHIFLCDTASATVLSCREKSLCAPLRAGGLNSGAFPFAFSIVFPHPTMGRASSTLYVLQWNASQHGLIYVAASERARRTDAAGRSGRGRRASRSPPRDSSAAGRPSDVRLASFDVRMPLIMPAKKSSAAAYGVPRNTGHVNGLGDDWAVWVEAPPPSSTTAGSPSLHCGLTDTYYLPLEE